MHTPDTHTVTPEVRYDNRLRRVIASTLAVTPEEISEDSSPDTVAAWDSLNHLNIVMAIEEEFGISLSAEDVMEMRNVGIIRTLLLQHGVDDPW